jgi:formylglycine-generating enzyme
MVHKFAACIFFVLQMSGGLVYADIFSMPSGQTSLQFVTVGDAGNKSDGHFGAVSYVYEIGKYDVTVAQYAEFLNSVAATDPYGLYNSNMANEATAPHTVGCGIVRSGNDGNYTYSIVSGHDNFPVNWVSWASAARFCNWLANGQPEGGGTTETGSYTINGATTSDALLAVTRNGNATYVLPSIDEWFKAAYYKGGGTQAGYWRYTAKSDVVPSNLISTSGTNNANFNDRTINGPDVFTDPVNFLTAVGTFQSSPGPYGTFDQGGDVEQWTELDPRFSLFGYFGGDFDLGSIDLRRGTSSATGPLFVNWGVGFRVASVPEPSAGTIALLLLFAVGLAARRKL